MLREIDRPGLAKMFLRCNASSQVPRGRRFDILGSVLFHLTLCCRFHWTQPEFQDSVATAMQLQCCSLVGFERLTVEFLSYHTAFHSEALRICRVDWVELSNDARGHLWRLDPRWWRSSVAQTVDELSTGRLPVLSNTTFFGSFCFPRPIPGPGN